MFTDRVFQKPRIPLGYTGPAFRSLACPRCGTPYALAGVASSGSFAADAAQLRRAAQATLDRLRRLQPDAALTGFLLVREGESEQLYQVSPEQPGTLSSEQWAALRRDLLRRHRCVALAREWPL